MIDEGPTKTPSLRFCPSSLMDGGQQDIANLEEWGSNVTLMRAELEKLLKEIKDLEYEQGRCVRLVEITRIEGAKLLQQSMSMRLSMFTRRVRHKHNLNANNVGLQIPIALSAAPNNAINDIAAGMLTLQPKNGNVSPEESTAVELDEE